MTHSESSRPDKREDDTQGAGDHFHRRGFFREGFRQLLRPFAEILEDRLERVGFPGEDSADTERVPPAGSDVRTVELPYRPLLRPPGALEEEEFLERCTSCAECVSVCPVGAIKLGRSDDPTLDAKPFIDPASQACVVCDELACMYACPTGALIPVPRDEIRMGRAVVRHEICVRSQGEDCQICVDKCPIGSQAIEISGEGGPVVVHQDGCTGCGVCEMYCPTEPRAIFIEPPEGAILPEEDRGGGDEDSESYFPMGYAPEEGCVPEDGDD